MAGRLFADAPRQGGGIWAGVSDMNAKGCLGIRSLESRRQIVVEAVTQSASTSKNNAFVVGFPQSTFMTSRIYSRREASGSPPPREDTPPNAVQASATPMATGTAVARPRPFARVGRALQGINPLRRLPVLPESHGWAGPSGMPGHSRSGVMAPRLGSNGPNLADRCRPATKAQVSAMDEKLQSAAERLARSSDFAPVRQPLLREQTTAAESLNQRLLQDFTAFGLESESASDASAFAHSALLASVCGSVAKAHEIWDHLCEGDDHSTLNADARELTEGALRAFAKNGPAYNALWTMKVSRGHDIAQTPENKMALREALQAIDTLIAYGSIGQDGPKDWKTVAEECESQRDMLYATRIGGSESNDALARMTLLHASHQLSGTRGTVPVCLRAASMAWRNGFTTSGKGTDFNRMVHRMHKFATWVRRAEQPRSPSRFIQRVFGRQLSPLSAMRHGLLGGDLGDLETETKALADHTHAALDRLNTAVKQVINSNAYASLSDKSKVTLQSQSAVLDHWKALGDNLHVKAKLPRKDVRQLLASHRSSSTPGSSARDAMRVLRTGFTLNVLEDWANNPELSDHAQILDVQADVNKARETAFPLLLPEGDVLNKASLQKTAKRALDTEGVQFRHRGLAGIEPVVSLGLPSAASVAPGVGITTRYARGRSATVRIGTSTTGSEIFLGTERRSDKGVSGFAYAGLVETPVRLGVVGQVFYREERGHETGVCLRVSKTVAEHKAQCGDVIDFLFDPQAGADNGPSDAQALWQNFANRFIDSDVSVNFVEVENKRRRTAGSVSLGVGLAFEKQTVGLHLRARAERRVDLAHRSESAGHAISNVASDRRTTSLVAGAALSWNFIPSVGLTDGTGQVATVGVPAMPLISYQATYSLPSSSAARVRVTLQDDGIMPALSLQHREFMSPNQLLGHVQERRALWETALGGASKFDEVMRDIRGLDLAPHQSAGNRWFVERLQLSPTAARKLTLLHAQREFCLADKSEGSASRRSELDGAYLAELADSKNWLPEKLAVIEIGYETASFGPNYLVVANTVLDTTSVTRYLYQAKAKPPAPTLSDERATGPADVAEETDTLSQPSSPSQVEDFRRILKDMYGNRDPNVDYLHLALLKAFPPNGGQDSCEQARQCAAALREAAPRSKFAIQVLASMMSQTPSASEDINQAKSRVEAMLAQARVGRTGSPANVTNPLSQPSRPSQVEDFRRILKDMYGKRDPNVDYLHLALMKAFPPTEGQDPCEQARQFAAALHEAAPRSKFAIQVLASMMLQTPSASEDINQAKSRVASILAQTRVGRAG